MKYDDTTGWTWRITHLQRLEHCQSPLLNVVFVAGLIHTFLSAEYCEIRLRLQWVHESTDWSLEWRKVLSGFNVNYNDDIHIRRYGCDFNHPDCIIRTPNVIVCSYISYSWRSQLLSIVEWLTDSWNNREVVSRHVSYWTCTEYVINRPISVNTLLHQWSVHTYTNIS